MFIGLLIWLNLNKAGLSFQLRSQMCHKMSVGLVSVDTELRRITWQS